jgi:2-deoxy-D-gluconate 3-dehydrogenase
VFRLCQCAFPALRNRGGGKIINLASEYAVFGCANAAPYAASKGGLVQLTKSLAIAWAPERIRVNAILPGYIRTEMTAAITAQPERHDRALARTPAGRMGEPDDVVGAAIFLASRASEYVTGAVLTIDGGYAIT